MILRYSNPSRSRDVLSLPRFAWHLAPPVARLIALLVWVGSVLPRPARREGVGGGSWFVLFSSLGAIRLSATCALRPREVGGLVERTNWLARGRCSNTVPRFPYRFKVLPSVYGRFSPVFLAYCPHGRAPTGARTRTSVRTASPRAPCAHLLLPVGSWQGGRIKPAQNV